VLVKDELRKKLTRTKDPTPPLNCFTLIHFTFSY
jgi:hypothetical protein